MSAKVKLAVLEGPMKGKNFVFEEHDTLIFGRASDCHIQMAESDLTASRHHFLLEANPPDATVRDLGSLNGTWVNEAKHGGRAQTETPEEGARRQYPEVELKDGDQIRVGKSIMHVRLELAAVCCECNCAIPDVDRDSSAWIGGTFICAPCKAQLAASANPAAKPKPVLCQKCGREVEAEIGPGRRGDSICEVCRQTADPAEILFALLALAGKLGLDEPPEIAGYRIEKRLGVGGFGAVYLAQRKQSGDRVAVKVMLSRVAVSDSAREKFVHEMEVNRGLRHPHIVAFLDQGSAGGAFYFVMEYCNGGSVADLMARRGGKLAVPEAGPLILQALDGLAYAHSKNIVHRDLKPQNILLSGADRKWTAKIGDLGLAKNFQRAGLSGMTLTGSHAGTPSFMPREQVINFKYVKPVSDVWSMGATLYYMLTGAGPRDFPPGEDPMEIVLRGDVVPIRRRDPAISKRLAEVLDRCLTNDTKARYQNAAEMKEALARLL